MAISSARPGRLNYDKVLLQESLGLYSTGLSELQKALWNPNLMNRDDTLAACFALSLCEVTGYSSESGLGYLSITIHVPLSNYVVVKRILLAWRMIYSLHFGFKR